MIRRILAVIVFTVLIAAQPIDAFAGSRLGGWMKLKLFHHPAPVSSLLPGPGFIGPPAELQNGSSSDAAYAYRATGLFVTPNYQDVTGDTFKITVTGFKSPSLAAYAIGIHEDIAKVTLYLDGGPGFDITASADPDFPNASWGINLPTYNYTIPSLSALGLSAGKHEIRAVVHPNTGWDRAIWNGSTRVRSGVQSLIFYYNPTNSLQHLTEHINPAGTDSTSCGSTIQTACASFQQAIRNADITLNGGTSTCSLAATNCHYIEGVTILCAAGNYPLGLSYANTGTQAGAISGYFSRDGRWTLLTHEPGLSATACNFPRNFDPHISRLHIKDVELTKTTYDPVTDPGTPYITGQSSGTLLTDGALWADGVYFSGLGPNWTTNKYCNLVGKPANVVMYAYYGDYHQKGLWVTGGEITNTNYAVKNGFMENTYVHDIGSDTNLNGHLDINNNVGNITAGALMGWDGCPYPNADLTSGGKFHPDNRQTDLSNLSLAAENFITYGDTYNNYPGIYNANGIYEDFAFAYIWDTNAASACDRLWSQFINTTNLFEYHGHIANCENRNRNLGGAVYWRDVDNTYSGGGVQFGTNTALSYSP